MKLTFGVDDRSFLQTNQVSSLNLGSIVVSYSHFTQTQYLNASMEAVPAIVQGIRQICAIASTILGKPVASNGEAEGQTPIVVPSPTGGSDAAMRAADSLHFGATAALGAVGLLSLFAGIGTVWL